MTALEEMTPLTASTPMMLGQCVSHVSVYYTIIDGFYQFLYTLITPQWKVL